MTRAVAFGIVVWLCSMADFAAAGQLRGTVVDQSNLPVPGATVELRDGRTLLASTVSSQDGGFVLEAPRIAGTVMVSLPGFQTVTVPAADAIRVVLALAGIAETTVVSGSPVNGSAPTESTFGTELQPKTLARLPTARQHARDVLPLLPSVIRGPDGLLNIEGTRPHEAALLLDGFNITDPATGVSAIDLPLEAVSNIAVLRDPASVTFGNALGPLATIDTRTGAERVEFGAQGFFPRLRIGSGGFGRIEGLFPRSFIAGQAGGGRVRYFGAAEYDYERIPVPGVTVNRRSPDTKETSATFFGRLDLQRSPRHSLTVEGLYFPSQKVAHALSPLRPRSAAPTRTDTDGFLGVIDRYTLGSASVLTLRAGALSHSTRISPDSMLDPELTPLGRNGASFSTLQRYATRLTASAAWQGSIKTAARGTHDLSAESTVDRESLQGEVTERAVNVRDANGALVRRIEFGAPGALKVSAGHLSGALRDNWRVNDALQVEAGMRFDWSSLGGLAPSARLGARYVTSDSSTAISGTVGGFVGTIPLTVPAFASFPVRRDTSFDRSGAVLASAVLTPAVSALSLPRSLAANLRVERRLAPGWDMLFGTSLRQSAHLATIAVPTGSGTLAADSSGRARYREFETAVRHTWGDGNEAFLSYTRSSATGTVNDFSTVFALGDTEILLPGAVSRLPADAPHRWLAWSTLTLPRGFIISPALEWHSGFPYSPLDARRDYVAPPNSSSFPAFFSLDLGGFKTVAFRGRRIKTGLQVFNVTNHFNPREVYAVAGARRFGTFTNSVGPTVRGVLTFLW